MYIQQLKIGHFLFRDPANGHGCLQFHSSMILTDTPGKMFYNYFNKGMF